MNLPEKSYESDGWFCQKVTRLRSRSGRRSRALSAGGRVSNGRVTVSVRDVPTANPQRAEIRARQVEEAQASYGNGKGPVTLPVAAVGSG